jgi:hypothetical protein
MLEMLSDIDKQKKNLANSNYFSFDGFYHPANILLNDEKLKSMKNKIFFVESHLNRDRVIDKPRVACSIESAGGFHIKTKHFFVKSKLKPIFGLFQQ